MILFDTNFVQLMPHLPIVNNYYVFIILFVVCFHLFIYFFVSVFIVTNENNQLNICQFYSQAFIDDSFLYTVCLKTKLNDLKVVQLNMFDELWYVKWGTHYTRDYALQILEHKQCKKNSISVDVRAFL